jgi:predicted DNA-binding transcriptional regulator YafY
MSLGKNPVLRYRIINSCFTNKQQRYWSLQELINKLADHDLIVERRSIERDLESMRHDDRVGYHAPIAFCRKNKGYHYTDPDYSIDKLPLSAEDVEAFELIVESFKRFKGAEVLSQVEGMFDKLDKVVMGKLKPRRNSDVSYTVVDFEKMPYCKGIEHFDSLYQAIIKQQPLNVSYRKFDNEKTTMHLFHPYLLKEYKFRWYVLGFSERRRVKLILALDRIESMQQASAMFKPYKGADVDKYFHHTIGVTIKSGGVQKIRLWFSASQGNYIKSQHLHATQQIESDTTEGLVATLQLIPNYELLQTLLSFGPEVRVLEPLTLRDELKDMLTRSLALYKR